MKDLIIKMICNRFMAALTKLLSGVSVGLFGVEAVQANDASTMLAQSAAAFVALVISASVDQIEHCLKDRLLKRMENISNQNLNNSTRLEVFLADAEEITENIVMGIEEGKPPLNPKVVDLSDKVKHRMGPRAVAKVDQIRHKFGVLNRS